MAIVLALQDSWLGKGINWGELGALAGIAVEAGAVAAGALRHRA